MDDKQILSHINELVRTEHEQLRSVEEALDRCWDLLRQRRARQEFGENPDEAAERPAAEVEEYLQ